MGRFGIMELLIFPFSLILPAIILYYIVKFAVKNAVRELKRDGII
jgi:hypothetical protein